MPKDTFFNLSDEKRKKIEKALEKEFSRTTFEKSSISNIIEEADIPRGSFYQYFEDKEDAERYIVQKYILKENALFKKFLKENNGDIFKIAIKAFDYIVSEAQKKNYANLFVNILQDMRKNNISIFSEEDNRDFKKLIESIDKSILNINDKDDEKYIIKIIFLIVRASVVDVIHQKSTIIEARRELKKQIEILKRGMKK